MLRHVLRRLLWLLLIVAGVGSLTFFMARRLPGDPARLWLGPQASAEDVAHARKSYGLDQSAAQQYLRFWQRLVHLRTARIDHRSCAPRDGAVHLDLGYSYRYRKPVTTLLADKAPKSLQLALAALFVQLVFGVGIGMYAAKRRGQLADQLSIGATLIGVSTPTFVLGLMLQYLLAHRLGWLPDDGYGQTSAQQWRSLVLPALTLGLFGAALYARLTRNEMATALEAEHVVAARARGAGGVRLLLVHGLRNALLPIVTLLTLDLGSLIGGAIVTEKLFRWPGLGSMAVDAMVNRDGPVIFGSVLISAAAMVLASLAADITAWLLDPRARDTLPPERV